MMATRSLSELLAGWGEQVPAVEIGGVTLYSREVTPGVLFLACVGSQRHGLEFAAQAVADGAVAIAWEPAAGISAPRDCGVPVIAVPDLHLRAGEIAARFFDDPSRSIAVSGITGTDGKTSTAYLLAQALSILGRPCEYIGTLGSGFIGELDEGRSTTPDAVSLQHLLRTALKVGASACALEASSHALDQGRVNGVRFATTVLTNVGRDHLDYHGDVEHYVMAKRRLFGRGDGAPAILNRDDTRGRQFADELGGECRVVLYGLGGNRPAGPHVLGRGLVTHARGLSFEVLSNGASAVMDSGLLGRFNAYNLLAAAATLLEYGVSLTDACGALSNVQTVPGRAEAFHGPGSDALVVVDYAHTPQALAGVLAALREHTHGRLVCVFGCGGDRDRGKRALMAQAAARAADYLVVTDDNPRSEASAAIIADICLGLPPGVRYEVCADRGQAIRSAVAATRPGDTVLVAGKGHENYQIYGDEWRPFSDRALAAELVGMELAS
ncbi:MAG: UDP-N-acetylmuramoyl-L-alanyl-D-glutamate--2,6-diaminopimelate ligase [Sinobacteraceae bacterium]|nr:UDP-N-acetylmuramoyl-L-alanyl-D-glutamate--2,6-diaminopimelate ligase [Nevskiaceae bacterium]